MAAAYAKALAVLILLGTGLSGCATGTPAAQDTVRSTTLNVLVNSVTATLSPYNPRLTDKGIPAAHIDFTVSGLLLSSTPSPFHCTIGVFRSGRQVGMTSVATGAPPGYTTSSQSVMVAVTGGSFAARPSDAHISCRLS